MRPIEFDQALRSACEEAMRLRKTIEARKQTLERCRKRCDELVQSVRIAEEGPEAPTPSEFEVPTRVPLSPSARAEASLGAILLITAALAFGGGLLSSSPRLVMGSYVAFVAGLNLLWVGGWQLRD